MKIILMLGSASGFIGVLLGAFGAHILKDRLGEYSMQVFKTGVEYQFIHGLALLIVALLFERYPAVRTTAWCFCGGIVLFSGSLYVLALTGIKIFGAITPIGGTLFLVGWLALLWTVR